RPIASATAAQRCLILSFPYLGFVGAQDPQKNSSGSSICTSLKGHLGLPVDSENRCSRHPPCTIAQLLLHDFSLTPPLRHIAAFPSFLASLEARTPIARPVVTRKPMVPGIVPIVIPCFNYRQYLGKAIYSAQAQQYRPFEIIVVDDGSTDDSATIAEHAGVRLIRQPNAGLGVARNAGLAEAAGEFVLFLDADDELLPDAVATGVAVLRARPAVACVVRLCQLM